MVTIAHLQPSEVVAHRPMQPEGDADDGLFGVLDEGAVNCAPVDPSAFAVDSNRFLVILDRDSAMPQGLVEHATVRRVYRTLPIIEVDMMADRVPNVTALEGVMEVLPALAVIDRTRTIAIGLDFLSTVAARQETGTATGLLGGIAPHGPGGYPVVEHDGTGWIVSSDPGIVRPAPPAILPVINMSIGTHSVTYPSVKNDIVNLATLGATTHSLLVVAAGNCGGVPGESLSAWAQPAWVLAVGATEDETGTVLAAYSSRGASGDDASGPDLVACGRSLVPPHPHGTSFAAPRITGLARTVAAAFSQLGREVRMAQGAPDHGVPLVGYGILDNFGKKIWHEGPRAALPISALPILGVDRDAVAQCVSMADDAGLTIDVVATPQLLREVLIASARPMARYGPHEVGAGFVDGDAVLAQLAACTGVELLTWFGSGEPDVNLVAKLRRHRLFLIDELSRLAQILALTGPVWRYDYRRGRISFLPIGDDPLQTLTPEQRTHGIALDWPPLPP